MLLKGNIYKKSFQNTKLGKIDAQYNINLNAWALRQAQNSGENLFLPINIKNGLLVTKEMKVVRMQRL